MRICYQVATKDVINSNQVTSYQGNFEEALEQLSLLGYRGVELMTLNPYEFDWKDIKEKLIKNGLSCTLVCTGEIYAQLGLSYTDPFYETRRNAIAMTKRVIDFASYLGANVNIGRIRGKYSDKFPKEITEGYAISAFRELAEYAAPKNVMIALEAVCNLQTDFINNLEEAATMVMRVDRDNFRLMMDVFHMNIEEKDIYEAINKYSHLNIHVHLADNNRKYPGQCGLDFRKIIRCFKENGYEGDFSVEILQFPNAKEAAKGAIEHLLPIIREVY